MLSILKSGFKWDGDRWWIVQCIKSVDVGGGNKGKVNGKICYGWIGEESGKGLYKKDGKVWVGEDWAS